MFTNGLPQMPVILKDYMIPSIVALLMGAGGAISYRQVVDPRPDPFTGSAAREMELRIHRDIREYVTNHYPYDEREEARVARLEEKMDRVLTEVLTLKAHLDHLYPKPLNPHIP